MTDWLQGPTLTLLSVNVNGLGSAPKAGALLAYQQRVAGPVDAVFLQECKQPRGDNITALLHAGAGAGTPWRGELAYSPGTSHSCGTAILASPAAATSVTRRLPPTHDAAGRVVCWDWDAQHHRLRLLAVYAPAQPAERPAFFDSLAPYLDTDRVVLLGGDLNCVLAAHEEAAPSPGRRQGAEQLRSLMQAYGLVDPWPTHGSGTAGFTHPATPKPASAARLDRWLVGQAAVPWLLSVRRLPGAPADHHGVLLRLQLPGLPPLGRSGWRLPTYLLYHPSLKSELMSALEQQLQGLAAAPGGDDPCSRWDAAKQALRTCADLVHRKHAKQLRAAVARSQQMARAALQLLDQHPGLPAARSLADFGAARARAATQAAHQAASTAQEALYQHQGERGTRWTRLLRPRSPSRRSAFRGLPSPCRLWARM